MVNLRQPIILFHNSLKVVKNRLSVQMKKSKKSYIPRNFAYFLHLSMKYARENRIDKTKNQPNREFEAPKHQIHLGID